MNSSPIVCHYLFPYATFCMLFLMAILCSKKSGLHSVIKYPSWAGLQRLVFIATLDEAQALRSLKLFPSCWETLRILLQFKMLECTDLRSHFLCFIVILDLWGFHMRYEYLPYWLVFIHFVFIHANSTHFSTWSHSKTLVTKKQYVCSSKSTQIGLFFNDRVFPPNSLFDYYFQTLKSASSKFS